LTDKISLIIPLRLTANTFEGELRLRRICDTVPRDLFDILISDYGTEDAHAGPLRALEAEGVAVVRHPSPKALFSIGDARDFGVRMARGKVVRSGRTITVCQMHGIAGLAELACDFKAYARCSTSDKSSWRGCKCVHDAF